MKVLIVSADGFEDLELLVPFYRLAEAGAGVDVAAPKLAPIRGKHGYEVAANRSVHEVDEEGYDLLILPGGKAPAVLREDERVQQIARWFMEAGKPVAAICHGPQILISAGVMRGRTATCAPPVAAELQGAGATYEDREVVVDGNLVTARRPSDLPAFLREVMRKLGSR
jgi:protease I